MGACHIRLPAVTGSVEGDIKKEKRGIFFQMTEVRGQKTEDGYQMTNNRNISILFCPLFSVFCHLPSDLCLLTSVLRHLHFDIRSRDIII